MSYAYGPRTALGYDVQIDTPIGVQTVSFDLDKVSKDVATAVVNEAYPQLEKKAKASLPSFVDAAYQHAQPHIAKELTNVEGRAKKIGVELIVGLGVTLVGASLLSSWLTGSGKGKVARAWSAST